MKLVINRQYGVFRLPLAFAQKYHFNSIYDDIDRFDPRLIEWVENHDTNLSVVELPADTTDYSIEEYDGAESVIYVVDGKLNWA